MFAIISYTMSISSSLAAFDSILSSKSVSESQLSHNFSLPPYMHISVHFTLFSLHPHGADLHWIHVHLHNSRIIDGAQGCVHEIGAYLSPLCFHPRTEGDESCGYWLMSWYHCIVCRLALRIAGYKDSFVGRRLSPWCCLFVNSHHHISSISVNFMLGT